MPAPEGIQPRRVRHSSEFIRRGMRHMRCWPPSGNRFANKEPGLNAEANRGMARDTAASVFVATALLVHEYRLIVEAHNADVCAQTRSGPERCDLNIHLQSFALAAAPADTDYVASAHR